MIDETDIHRLDEIYVRKDYCNEIQDGVDKNLPTIPLVLPCWNISKK